ncbi:MAG: hypothetical protein WCK65_04610 [Rhodospirillaceae bacterium]
MKGIVLLVIGIILLAAAGGGSYYAYTRYINPSEDAGHPKEVKPLPPPLPVYVRIPAIEVPVVGANRVEQIITLVVVLQVEDNAAAERTSSRMPQINDALMTGLYAAIDEGLILRGELVDISAVKQTMLQIAARLLGKDMVKEVMVQTVLQRRL